MNLATLQPDDKAFMQQQQNTGWGSYLYQNFLLPALSPSATLDWMITTPNPSQTQQAQQQSSQNISDNSNNLSAPDYFGLPASAASTPAWLADTAAPATVIKPEPIDPISAAAAVNSVQQQQQQQHMHQRSQPQAGPSSFYPQPFYYPSSTGIATSLLTQTHNTSNHFSGSSAQPSSYPLTASQRPSTDSVHIIDSTITRSPSPLSSHIVSPHPSPLPVASRLKRGTARGRGKKRSHSIHSDSDISISHSHDDHDHDHDHDHDIEHEPEVPEGVERDGMIWGMKVEDYRALSARERRRVRNRISARTFRAKRKEHLSSLEHTLGAKDLQIKLANEETARLRREVAELKKKLSKYEKPYDRPL
ncbi:hypothetical protein I317_06617 [Kwoniella heveanensis CBS 569]|nr:hypothetical protein I317_06617 [Kwoniella heveanensis CBS 569]